MTSGRLAFALTTALLAKGCGVQHQDPGEVQSALNLCLGLSKPACCTDDDCNDGNDCTVDTCMGAVLNLVPGTCTYTPVDDSQCCNTSSDCPQISGCGAPTCELQSNTWKDCGTSGGSATCCSKASDCPTIECNIVACTATLCVYTATPLADGCCSQAADCGSSTRCQAWSCESAQCVAVATQASGCCTDVGDCTPNSCQDAHCQDNACVYVARPGIDCCATDSDCNAMIVCGPSTCVNDVCVPPGGCGTNDLSQPDLTTGDAAALHAQAVALAGGGGCQIARASTLHPTALLLIVAAILLVRRRTRTG